MGAFETMGFSGTRNGMTRQQFEQLRLVLIRYAPTEVHHGDCIGSDAQFHDLCRSLFGKLVSIESHPPLNPMFRAWMKADIIHEEKPYSQRDMDIAKACGVLVATPATPHRVGRSGTWMTIGFAQELERPVILITPRGHEHRLS